MLLQRGTFRLVPTFGRRVAAARTYVTPTDNPVPANSPKPLEKNSPVSSTNELPTTLRGAADTSLQEDTAAGEEARVMQAPNRASTWSRSQQPRATAMVGPRFEQTMFEEQPRPYAAIELIHQQPVTWTHERTVSCDGGGGPLGHPRIFINVDKPQICWCTYCGLPFAHEHHRKHLESLPSTNYPLERTGNAAQIPESHLNAGGKTGATAPYQTNSNAPFEQR